MVSARIGAEHEPEELWQPRPNLLVWLRVSGAFQVLEIGWGGPFSPLRPRRRALAARLDARS